MRDGGLLIDPEGGEVFSVTGRGDFILGEVASRVGCPGVAMGLEGADAEAATTDGEKTASGTLAAGLVVGVAEFGEFFVAEIRPDLAEFAVFDVS